MVCTNIRDGARTRIRRTRRGIDCQSDFAAPKGVKTGFLGEVGDAGAYDKTDLYLQHEHGPWASEASILTYELLRARRAPDLAEQRDRLLQRWPGLAFRVREIDTGAGLLTMLRSEYGPESRGR